MTALRSALLAVCICMTATRSNAESIPQLPAQTLSGKSIVVPRDLHATSILVVGFTKRSRNETDGWSKRLRDDRQLVTTAAIYDVVALDGVPGFIRSAIQKQLLSGVPKPRHDRFLIVSEGVDRWKRFLRATEEDSAYVALVTSKGDVIWTVRGAVSDAAYEQLKASVARGPH
jgi:hypothetical protein